MTKADTLSPNSNKAEAINQSRRSDIHDGPWAAHLVPEDDTTDNTNKTRRPSTDPGGEGIHNNVSKEGSDNWEIWKLSVLADT